MSEVDLYFLATVVILAFITSLMARKKKDQFKESADKFISSHGFKKVNTISSNVYKKGFNIFALDDDGQIENILFKKVHSKDIYIFDFKYIINSGNGNSRTASQRVVYVQLPGELLYQFELKPEGFFDKVKQAIGFEDIDYDDYKEFSKKYALTALNKEIIERNFPPELMKELVNKNGVCIEARSDCILIYNNSEHQYSAYEALYKDVLTYTDILVGEKRSPEPVK
ncbi:hypothetical protein FE810_00675 [Thalassotalea litorea]|uniref:DUF3137 domain-containing protein n=1 Tax=Thalassotalea litorea TaxID=2020715 RepID=A0A5R9IQE6_9GAMM|nr:hypothetical protein [Thalassotalea litorea]TLU67502.1 hypothetical protein FE810_00675 [Thalassotalea litorea]